MAKSFCNAVPVTALMLIGDYKRKVLAENAIEQFQKQTYQEKELLIVNSSSAAILDPRKPIPNVAEVMADPTKLTSLGALRDFGLANVTTDWVIQWDDDDHHHPHRMAFQMAHRSTSGCCVLRYQLRVDILHATAAIHEEPEGIPNTILFKVGSHKYLKTSRNEDGAFLGRFSKNRVVLDNSTKWFPGPALSIAFWHDKNIKSRDQFMGDYARVEWEGKVGPGVTQDLIDYLSYVAETYGLSLDFVPLRATGN